MNKVLLFSILSFLLAIQSIRSQITGLPDLFSGNNPYTYSLGTAEPDSGWKLPGFDDSSWATGRKSGNIPALTFSHERGYYYTSFELTLTASTGGCIIKYTLDGSDPRNSPDALVLSSPASLPVNPYIGEGRAITPGIVVRAVAICNSDTGAVETHTYIFPAEVKFQSDISPELTPYWPDQTYEPCTYPSNLIDWMRSDYQLIDLGVDPEVVTKEEYFPVFEEALLDIPTLSLVTDPENLFDPSAGIYINSVWPGIEWERPGSIELINSSGDGFQSNAGIRIRGGWSSSGVCAKHAFRLFFRKEYGNGKLEYPLFEDEGVDRFDKIDLRCDQNNSWHMQGGNINADFVHDLVARDIQGDMQQPYTRSRYYHLFLNGMYWGLYQTQERPAASYAESYFGGDKEDYDVIKSSGPSTDWEPYTLEATDGDLSAARSLWEVAKQGFSPENYNKVLGLNPDGTRNPEYKILLDKDNLIDYMIIIYFIANRDGPGELNGGIRINNFFGIFDREDPEGFKFFIHDAETAFANVNDNITNSPTIAGEDFERFNPAWLHQELIKNEEYRQTFADRASQYLYNDGVLTPDKNIARFLSRAGQIDQAIIGESARWGDVTTPTGIPYTKNDTWMPVILRFREDYFPKRTGIMIDQFRSMGWLNDLRSPEFDTNDFVINETGTRIAKGGTFNLINPNDKGDIYYTLDGTDPRMSGGKLSGDAILYTDEIRAVRTVFIKARIKDGDTWSPLTERVITLLGGSNLKISEISYNPGQLITGSDTLLSQELEFIELKNSFADSLDVSGYAFTRGIRYEFPLNSILPPDSLVVIASDSASFSRLYGFSPFGQYEGQLSNEGEEISLALPSGKDLIRLVYNEDQVWYDATDGSGFSLVFSDYSRNQLSGIREDWRVSTNRMGSPGKDDPVADADTIVITEVLANTAAPLVDAIELYNPSASDKNIGNWYLSDDKDNPDQWRIPEGTIIPAKEYAVFYEGHYLNDTLQYAESEFGQAFSVSPAGETLYLYSGSSDGKLLHFICDYKAGATEKSISFGDYKNALGKVKQVELDTTYLGLHNDKARKSPVIIKTIMYHPEGNNAEYIMLKNRTDSVVNLFHESDSSVSWQVDGIRFVFPGKVILNAGDSLFIVEKRIPAVVFRNIMKIEPEVQVYNYDGQLKNSSENISVEKPVYIENDTGFSYAYVKLESVEYNDESPWPTQADGNGYALQRKNEEAFADDAFNWTTLYNVIPEANAGSDRRVRVNKETFLDGSLSFDHDGKPLSYQWKLMSNPAGSSTMPSGNVKNPGITPDKAGNYVFSLEVNNGETKSIPSYVSIFAFENRPPMALTNKILFRYNVNTATVIDGSRSFDPDYEEIFFSWEIQSRPSGSIAEVRPNDGASPSFTPDVAGRYEIDLVVSDGSLNSAPCRVVVNALPGSGFTDDAITANTLIYPNPASSYVIVEPYLNNRTKASLSIADINGHEIYNQQIIHPGAGLYPFRINLSVLNMTGGVYFIRIQSEEFVMNRKIVFVR
jgi:hypothetical protein